MKRRVSPDILFMTIIDSLPRHEACNRLMRVSDRELAISTLYMEEGLKLKLLSFLGPEKNRRVKQEIVFVDRLYIKYPHYKLVMEELMLKISGELSSSSTAKPHRSYIRPRNGHAKRTDRG